MRDKETRGPTALVSAATYPRAIRVLEKKFLGLDISLSVWGWTGTSIQRSSGYLGKRDPRPDVLCSPIFSTYLLKLLNGID